MEVQRAINHYYPGVSVRLSNYPPTPFNVRTVRLQMGLNLQARVERTAMAHALQLNTYAPIRHTHTMYAGNVGTAGQVCTIWYHHICACSRVPGSQLSSTNTARRVGMVRGVMVNPRL